MQNTLCMYLIITATLEGISVYPILPDHIFQKVRASVYELLMISGPRAHALVGTKC